jgi:hypothetical protein
MTPWICSFPARKDAKNQKTSSVSSGVVFPADTADNPGWTGPTEQAIIPRFTSQDG